VPSPDELEDAAAEAATASLRAALEALTRAAVALYASLNPAGRAAGARVAALQLRALADGPVPAQVGDVLREHVVTAIQQTADEAAQTLGVAQRQVTTPIPLIQQAIAVPDTVREALREGAQAAERATDSDELQQALSVARRAVTRADRDVRTTVNRALSEGTRAVTDQAGAGRLIIPERDACVHCLAYAGEVAAAGEDFRGGLTFGRKPLTPVGSTVRGVPLHPRCRCREVAFVLPSDDPNDVSSEAARMRVEALKREALRSVLRGWSLPSERPSVRLDAAERALANATRLPKSVQDYARKAIKKGAFPRGNDFPNSPRDENRAVKLSQTNVRRPAKKTAPAKRVPAKKATPVARPVKTAPGGLDLLPKKTGKSTAAIDVKATNPRYGQPGYNINCTHVVVAYELRRRGYDVEATALPTELWGQSGRDSREILHRFRDTEGRARDFTHVTNGAQAQLIAESWPDGARGWVRVGWWGGGGHIFTVQKVNGQVVWTDAQVGRRVSPFSKASKGYFTRAQAVAIVRVDDLVPTDAIAPLVIGRPPD